MTPEEALLELIRAEAVRRGYRFQVTREGAIEVARLIRPDGTTAVEARRPAPAREEGE